MYLFMPWARSAFVPRQGPRHKVRAVATRQGAEISWPSPPFASWIIMNWTNEASMTIEEMVLEKLRGLPPGKQEEVLKFVQSLQPAEGANKPLRSLEGLWEDLNIDITEDDIAEARREMWGNFPRDIEL